MAKSEFQAEDKLASAPNNEPGGQGSQRSVFIRSYGCQMNVYDAQRMGDALEAAGYKTADAPDHADLVILNTCHIREKASEKVFSELGKLRKLKSARQGRESAMNIVVAGCVAQAEGEEILRRQPAVDLVIGPQNYHRLVDLASAAAHEGRGIVDTEFPLESKFDYLDAPSSNRVASRGVSAFVTVQEGCDKFCTFCVVPYTRGAEESRPPEGILQEVRTLAAGGVREVTLIGQNVNAYSAMNEKGQNCSLAGLIDLVSEVPGIDRIRYTTSHPRDMAEDLIVAHRDHPALMPFLHLPVQSGSDRILAAMNRRHTAREYLELVEKIREARPDIAMSSDFIVGFPGETDEDFRDTMQLIRQAEFATTFSFKYSPRPGTTASEETDGVPSEAKDARLHELQKLVEDQRQAFNRGTVGKRLEVLFEKPGRYQGQLVGKTPYLQTVQVDAPESLIGRICEIDVVRAGSNSLFGELIDPENRGR